MSFDLQRILESKRAFRQRLAAQPIAEKLRMLDALRARTLSLRSAAPNAPRSRPSPGAKPR
jgi:hypothetical protein